MHVQFCPTDISLHRVTRVVAYRRDLDSQPGVVSIYIETANGVGTEISIYPDDVHRIALAEALVPSGKGHHVIADLSS